MFFKKFNDFLEKSSFLKIPFPEPHQKILKVREASLEELEKLNSLQTLGLR
jgi:hypothetical protein